MSNRAKNLAIQVLDFLLDGPRCRCGHDMAIHDEGKCLGAIYDRFNTHEKWCDCVIPMSKKEKRRERD